MGTVVKVMAVFPRVTPYILYVTTLSKAISSHKIEMLVRDWKRYFSTYLFVTRPLKLCQTWSFA